MSGRGVRGMRKKGGGLDENEKIGGKKLLLADIIKTNFSYFQLILFLARETILK